MQRESTDSTAPLVRSVELAFPPCIVRDANFPAVEAPSVISDNSWQIAEPPQALSIAIASPRPRVKSFSFAEPDGGQHSPPAEHPFPPPTSRQAASQMAPPSRRTRVQPPADVIKLSDRLHYLLQPPLEMLIQSASLQFPFQPFPYQLDGIAFLFPRQHAILADEMGLGKTMQAISAIRLLLHAGELRRVLLVCPKPLVSNWRREFGLWAPELPLNIVAGNQSRRHWQWQMPDAVVTIANYELLVRDEEALAHPDVEFDLVVLDESQRIKNASSATSRAVRSIARSRSWALTGTPVENSPDDLVGIFEFLSPGFLRPGMKSRAIGRAVADSVLRRTKDRVLADLPPKLIRDAEVELTIEQRESYRLAEDEGVVKLTELGDELTIQHVFQLVLRLKQICNFDPVTGASAKLDQLASDLEECVASGRKAIVFSQWVATLERLKQHFAPLHPLEYHGRVSHREREHVIERFRDDARSRVLLMSYGAGSVGLNLQFCSYVFLFDRWWNPAVEDQAINRAHRIGASGPVTVTRFLSLGTIEQRIDEILQQKRDLFDTIFATDQPRQNVGMTRDEIFSLFELRTPEGPLDAAA